MWEWGLSLIRGRLSPRADKLSVVPPTEEGVHVGGIFWGPREVRGGWPEGVSWLLWSMVEVGEAGDSGPFTWKKYEGNMNKMNMKKLIKEIYVNLKN